MHFGGGGGGNPGQAENSFYPTTVWQICTSTVQKGGDGGSSASCRWARVKLCSLTRKVQLALSVWHSPTWGYWGNWGYRWTWQCVASSQNFLMLCEHLFFRISGGKDQVSLQTIDAPPRQKKKTTPPKKPWNSWLKYWEQFKEEGCREVPSSETLFLNLLDIAKRKTECRICPLCSWMGLQGEWLFGLCNFTLLVNVRCPKTNLIFSSKNQWDSIINFSFSFSIHVMSPRIVINHWFFW